MDRDPLLAKPEYAPAWVPDIDDEVAVARLRLAIKVLLALALVGWVVKGADSPADPVVTDEPLPSAVAS